MDSNESKRKRRVTAIDVAKAAGVSRSAVSRAFTQGAYVDQEKKERILQISQDLGYRPNVFAAGLHRARSNIIAIVAGEFRSQYDHELIDRLLQELLALGKWPIVLNGAEITKAPSLEGIFGFPVDAMIVRGGSVNEFVVESCAKLDIPLIFSGCIVDAEGVDSVCCRNYDGMYRVAKLLAGTGRRKIAYVDGFPNRASKSMRPEGARAGLEDAGLALVATITSDFTFQGGLDATLELLAAHDLDAIMCANDETALGALSAIRDILGRKVPDDVAVTGFDDLKMAAWPGFNLTTARNPVNETVSAIIRLLSERLDDPRKLSEQVLLDSELVVRGTH